MKVLIIGASGFVGKEVLKDALARGYEVTSSQPKRGGDLPRGEGTMLFSVSAQNIVDAMKAEGVRRLVTMSNVGVGDTRAAVPWIAKKVVIPLFMPFLIAIFEDKERMEPIIMNSGLDWTIVRYNGIRGDKPKGTKKIAMDGRVGFMMSVPDSARFLVDMVEDKTYVGKAPSVSN